MDWYELAGSGRNCTGSSLTLFNEKGFLIGGTASNNKRKKEKGTMNNDIAASPWLQLDHILLPSMTWAPVIVNTGGLLNRAYHASAGAECLDNRIFVFGGVYSSCPDEIATDVLEIETSSIFGVQATLCENASGHECTSLRGLSAASVGNVTETKKVVLFGGSRNAQSVGQCSNDFYLFDPIIASSSTGTSSEKHACYTKLTAGPNQFAGDEVTVPCARAFHTTVVTGEEQDQLLLYGGQNNAGELLNDVCLCDLSNVTAFYKRKAQAEAEISAAKAAAEEAGEEYEPTEAAAGEDEGAAGDEDAFTVTWICLLENSAVISGRYMHSSYASMKPRVEGSDVDYCLYLSIMGGVLASGNASNTDVYTTRINLNPSNDPGPDGAADVDDSDAAADGQEESDGRPICYDFMKMPSSIVSKCPNLSAACVATLSTTTVPCAAVVVLNGNSGSLTITDDSVDLALACKKNRIKKIKEAKAAAAALNAAPVKEQEEDTSGLPKKVTYTSGDIYEGDLKLPAGYNEGDPIIPVTLIKHGKGKYTYKATGEVYEGTFVHNIRQGFGKSTRLYAGEADLPNPTAAASSAPVTSRSGSVNGAGARGRMVIFEGQYAKDDREGDGTLSFVETAEDSQDGISASESKLEDSSTTVSMASLHLGDGVDAASAACTVDGSEGKVVQSIEERLNIYTGQWSKGVFSGRGTLKYVTGEVYFGNFEDGQRHGVGTLRPQLQQSNNNNNNNSNSNSKSLGYEYIGEWNHDVIAGTGEVKNLQLAAAEDGSATSGVYEGITKDGIPWGTGGYCSYFDGSEYLGEWKRGKRNGVGTMIMPNMDTYEGKFIGNKRVGHGKLTTKAGDVLDGLWDKNVPHGHVQKTLANGTIIEGLYEYGVFRG